MSLKDQIGLTGPAYDVYVERGKIREFARAMEASLPEFFDLDAPIIPPTFLVCAPYTWGYTLERPRGTVFADIKHDLSVSLHAEESFTYHGEPPRAGDHLVAEPRLENVRETPGASGGNLTFLSILTEYRNARRDIVAEQRSTSVTTQATLGKGQWCPKPPEYKPAYECLERTSRFSTIRRQPLASLVEGKGPGPTNAAPLMKQEIVRFQGVVGEDDPLHHDTEWAAKNGYPSVFALGTHQASLMAAYASHWLDPRAVRSFRVRFREVVWPGDRLEYNGLVTSVDLARQTAAIWLTCKRARDELVSEAWAVYDFSEHGGS